MAEHERHDVVVVGAGISGLVAATELADRGIDVVVVEAKDRVGGRTYNRTIAGLTVDGGAAFVGPKQTALLDLIGRLGLATYDVRPTGDNLLVIEGERSVNRPDSLSEDDRAQFRTAMRAVNALADSIDVDEPWTTPDAARIDGLSLREWVMEQGVESRLALHLLDMSILSVLGRPSAELSALWAGWYFGQGGGLKFLTGIEGGAQDQKLVDGTQSISLKLAEGLGGRVRLESPARRVAVDEDGAVVDAGDSELRARRVIVACSPAEAAKITFEPALPDARRRLNEGWVMTGGHKPFLAYERAFWRDQGLSGQILADGAMGTVMDMGPASGAPGILLAFTDERELPDSPEGRRDAIAADLASVLGDEALNVIDYLETPWEEDEWVTGCVSPVPPGLLVDLWPTMNDPVGPIHWAGTETARQSAGYMDGAVRAGQRAAAEVGDSLGDRPLATRDSTA